MAAFDAVNFSLSFLVFLLVYHTWPIVGDTLGFY